MAVETGTGPSRLEHLNGLLAAFPLLPPEAVLKEDLLTEGVDVAGLARAPEVVALEGGPRTLRRLVVQVRPRAESPYRLETRDEALALVDARSGERLALGRAYPRRPGYAAKVFPSGRPYTAALDTRGVGRLGQPDGATPDEIAEAAAETFLLEPWETGERPLAIHLMLDDALAARSEAEQDAVALPAIEAIRGRIGNLRPVLLASPPRAEEGERRLLSAGLTGRNSPIPVWGRAAFTQADAGHGVSWDEWLERILAQAYVFVTTYTQPVLRLGTEPGWADNAEAARGEVAAGIRFLVQHRVLVRLQRGTAAGAGPSVADVLSLDQTWYETWQHSYADEPGGELLGPGHSRDPFSAALDLGRGAPLAPRTSENGGAR